MGKRTGQLDLKSVVNGGWLLVIRFSGKGGGAAWSWKWSGQTRRSRGCLTGATLLDTNYISTAVVGKVAQRLLGLLVKSLPLWLIRHPGLAPG